MTKKEQQEKPQMRIVNKAGMTELAREICFDDLEKVVKMINAGVDLEQTTVKGYTYLHLAAQDEQPLIVRELLKNGANVHAKTLMGGTALRIAVSRCKRFPVERSVEVINLLLEAGADADEVLHDISIKQLAHDSGVPEVAALFDVEPKKIDEVKILLDARVTHEQIMKCTSLKDLAASLDIPELNEYYDINKEDN